jgi:hypothetical protein
MLPEAIDAYIASLSDRRQRELGEIVFPDGETF